MHISRQRMAHSNVDNVARQDEEVTLLQSEACEASGSGAGLGSCKTSESDASFGSSGGSDGDSAKKWRKLGESLQLLVRPCTKHDKLLYRTPLFAHTHVQKRHLGPGHCPLLRHSSRRRATTSPVRLPARYWARSLPWQVPARGVSAQQPATAVLQCRRQPNPGKKTLRSGAGAHGACSFRPLLWVPSMAERDIVLEVLAEFPDPSEPTPRQLPISPTQPVVQAGLRTPAFATVTDIKLNGATIRFTPFPRHHITVHPCGYGIAVALPRACGLQISHEMSSRSATTRRAAVGLGRPKERGGVQYVSQICRFRG